MLEEDGARKYGAGNEQLFDLIKDFDTLLLFIGKAIELCKKENDYGELLLMEELYAWIKGQIAFSRNFSAMIYGQVFIQKKMKIENISYKGSLLE